MHINSLRYDNMVGGIVMLFCLIKISCHVLQSYSFIFESESKEKPGTNSHIGPISWAISQRLFFSFSCINSFVSIVTSLFIQLAKIMQFVDTTKTIQTFFYLFSAVWGHSVEWFVEFSLFFSLLMHI